MFICTTLSQKDEVSKIDRELFIWGQKIASVRRSRSPRFERFPDPVNVEGFEKETAALSKTGKSNDSQNFEKHLWCDGYE